MTTAAIRAIAGMFVLFVADSDFVFCKTILEYIMTFLQKIGVLIASLIAIQSVQAQTCNDSIEQSAPDARYTLQSGGLEVLDEATQLIWKHCPEGLSGDDCSTGTASTYTWSDALALSDNTWRLPNIKELASLVETACYGPAINLTIFPNTPSIYFWSSSPYASANSHALIVDFRNGSDSTYNKNASRYVRLVRGGL